MAIIATIIIFLLIISVLVLAHEGGHFFAARAFGVRVEEFGIGFPPRVKAWKKGSVVYSLNWLPLGGFVKLKGEQGEAASDPDSFAGVAIWKRIIILCAGVFMNIVLALALLTGGFMAGMPDIVDRADAVVQITISSVLADSAAMEADIRPGDIIARINGANVESVGFFQSMIAESAGKQLTLELLRDDQRIERIVRPRKSPRSQNAIIGVGFESYPPPDLSLGGAFIRAIQTTAGLSAGIFTFIGNAFSQRSFDHLFGPVGIAVVTGAAAQAGAAAVISLMAQLSVSLAVLNILPIPALDGGRMLFAVLEKIRGRPFRPALEQAIHVAGFLVLMLLLIAVTVRDIGRFLVL